MKTPLRWLDRFSYDHPNFGLPGLIRWVVMANVAVYVMDAVTSAMGVMPLSSFLAFYPGAVLHGQIWRLVTFVLVPESYSLTGLGPVWFMFSMLFYYYLGTALEQHWGTARFNLFYLCGVILTVIAAFLSYGITRAINPELAALFSMIPISIGQVNFSILLAFATVFPESQFRIYFLIPIKAKWLAVFYLAMRVWSYMRLAGPALLLMLPILLPLDLAAILNYLLFFRSEVGNLFTRTRMANKHRNSTQTINFKKAQKELRERRGYLHKCAVCGVTDQDDPNMEFRYCSKCNGYYCYCANHINNHTHVM